MVILLCKIPSIDLRPKLPSIFSAIPMMGIKFANLSIDLYNADVSVKLHWNLRISHFNKSPLLNYRYIFKLCVQNLLTLNNVFKNNNFKINNFYAHVI
jgi:hypothetical protein